MSRRAYRYTKFVPESSDWQPRRYKDYEWIVADPALLGGNLAIRGTRLSVDLILECLSNGMQLNDIDSAFHNAFPHAALTEVLKVAAELPSCAPQHLHPPPNC